MRHLYILQPTTRTCPQPAALLAMTISCVVAQQLVTFYVGQATGAAPLHTHLLSLLGVMHSVFMDTTRFFVEIWCTMDTCVWMAFINSL